MITAFWGGVPAGLGVTGVTRLIDTGAPTVVTPFAEMGPNPEVFTCTNTVPVKVPFGSPVGSAKTVRSMPPGPIEPMLGTTLTNHGLLSSVAVKGKVPSGKPGMCTRIGISVLLPAGALTLGFVGAVTGERTMRTVSEYGPKALAHGKNPRTR